MNKIHVIINSSLKNISYVLTGLSFCLLLGCKKYLDTKPVQSIKTPSTLDDMQAILDSYTQTNQMGPQLMESLSDNYYITTTSYNTRPPDDKTNYIWDKDATYYNNWYTPYKGPVYYSNVVLDQLELISYNESEGLYRNAIKGSALFIRAFAFFEIAQHYCLPFANQYADNPGIVLRLNSNINTPSVRSTVKQTYDQIISDLIFSATLLPETAIYPTRPTKAAAFGTLARVYLSMRDYNNANKYADSALKRNSFLTDYNTLIPVKNPPITLFNPEIVYFNRPTYHTILLNTVAKIDSVLIKSYDSIDLRKTVYFKANTDGSYGFQGSYEGTSNTYAPFDGIVTDELYLIKAECAARSENIDESMKWLNALLKTRWKSGKFANYSPTSSTDALNLVLTERRKELVFRGLRWTDLRRLNLEGANITLRRIINGVEYTLPPNDNRWVLLIPKEVINLTSLQQNPR